MTIAIGFICEDGIIVSSDSQMSYGDKFKRYEEPKVFKLVFPERVSAAIAISGSLDGANYFREILERETKEADIQKPRDIANLVEGAAKKTRSKILEIMDKDAASKEERDEHLAALNFSVLVAYYYSGKPFIYTLSLWHCLAVKSNRSFEAVGCGQDIASFILTGADLRNLKFDRAFALSVYVVEMCKKFDQACGGAFQHRALLKGTDYYPISFSQRSVDNFAKAVVALNETQQSKLAEGLVDIVNQFELKEEKETSKTKLQ